MRRVAYITSGKTGLHRFTYNEIDLLVKRKIEPLLCFTQLKKGSWMPKKEWFWIEANLIKAIRSQLELMIRSPKKLALLREALKLRVIPYYLMALSFYRDLKGQNLHSIHCQMGDDKLYIGYFLKKLLNLPLSVTVHAHELYQRKVYDQNELIVELFQSCDKVLTISKFNAEIIKTRFGVSEEKISLMRLFPDIDNKSLVKDKIRILTVANWVEKKGFTVLLRAISKINRDDFVLWIVGGPTYSQDSVDVEHLVDQYDLREKVAVLGSLGSPLIDIVYDGADIFCLPSITDYYEDGLPAEREGIPVALMEAMAWGKPVIATDHAGNSELIDECLVEEKDVEGLCQEIERLLSDKSSWGPMGVKNRKKVQSNFSKNNIEVLINTFDELGRLN
jgi:glycosyltransferase involved in cell wall biosynthesis